MILGGRGMGAARRVPASGTLGAWVARVAWWLELLYDALTAFIRSQP